METNTETSVAKKQQVVEVMELSLVVTYELDDDCNVQIDSTVRSRKI